MHHKMIEAAYPGDNVGLNIKGLDKKNMPKVEMLFILVRIELLNPLNLLEHK